MSTYSSFWRKNRSTDEVTEHVLCLRALRKVAGTIGRNVKPVYWKGMEGRDEQSITLEAERIKGQYPVPPEDFDILVGQVARESLATLEWGDWVIHKATAQAHCEAQWTVAYLTNIIAAAEDIYIHHLARSSVWSLYLSRYWQSELANNRRDANLPPDPKSLGDAWRLEAMFGDRLEQIHHYYHFPLEALRDYTAQLHTIVDMTHLAQRRSQRSALYVDVWHKIARIISDWEQFAVPPDAVKETLSIS